MNTIKSDERLFIITIVVLVLVGILCIALIISLNKLERNLHLQREV